MVAYPGSFHDSGKSPCTQETHKGDNISGPKFLLASQKPAAFGPVTLEVESRAACARPNSVVPIEDSVLKRRAPAVPARTGPGTLTISELGVGGKSN